jgi:hypothetical protein
MRTSLTMLTEINVHQYLLDLKQEIQIQITSIFEAFEAAHSVNKTSINVPTS